MKNVLIVKLIISSLCHFVTDSFSSQSLDLVSCTPEVGIMRALVLTAALTSHVRLSPPHGQILEAQSGDNDLL